MRENSRLVASENLTISIGKILHHAKFVNTGKPEYRLTFGDYYSLQKIILLLSHIFLYLSKNQAYLKLNQSKNNNSKVYMQRNQSVNIAKVNISLKDLDKQSLPLS